jgi:hypothetical protein
MYKIRYNLINKEIYENNTKINNNECFIIIMKFIFNCMSCLSINRPLTYFLSLYSLYFNT